jgi:PAS domain S-box-containing protein
VETPVAIDTDAAQFSRTLRNAILLPVGVIFLTALAVLLLGYEFLQVIKRSDHSREVALQTQTCEKSLLDLETGLLGYQLEGSSAFLAPYNQALTHVDSDFQKLKTLVARYPDLTASADQLIQAKDMCLVHARDTIDLRQQNKPPDPAWTRMGLTLRDAVRRQFDVFSAQEQQMRDSRLRDVQRMKVVLVLACSVLVLVLAVAVGTLVRRQFGKLALGHRRALHIIQQRHAALLRSETELEQQKEWFRVTLTSIGDGVIVTDKDGRIVFLNHEAERLTGWSSVEALLAPLGTVFRIIDEQTRAKMEDSVSQAFRHNQVVGPTRPGVLVSRSGGECPIEDSAAPIRDAKGEMLGVVLVFHDATAIRQAQAALREHSDELEQAVRERTANLQQAVNQLETFSYTVSHDLRSPLRAMQGYAHLALEDYGDRLDDQGRDYLTRIKNAAERLDRLIQDLLSYTRIARSDAPLADLDLDMITREIVENYPNLRPPAAEVNIEGRLPRVLGQESALTQVIANLLGNAAKFVPPGTVPHIDVRAENHDGHVRLCIEDNGIGVKPEDSERIFSMFVRANDGARYGGTGVGLAIVKKAVETMHGEVGVEPRPNGGSRFWVDLARADQKDA